MGTIFCTVRFDFVCDLFRFSQNAIYKTMIFSHENQI
jgi:hypothetical protein